MVLPLLILNLIKKKYHIEFIHLHLKNGRTIHHSAMCHFMENPIPQNLHNRNWICLKGIIGVIYFPCCWLFFSHRTVFLGNCCEFVMVEVNQLTQTKNYSNWIQSTTTWKTKQAIPQTIQPNEHGKTTIIKTLCI